MASRLSRLALLLATLCASLHSGRRAHATDDDVLATVRKNNNGAVKSIHTLYCRYSKLNTDAAGKPRPDQEPSGEYWRSAGMVRQKTHHADGKSGDRLVRDGRATTVATTPAGGRPRLTAFVAAEDGVRGPLDPWVVARLTFVGSVKRPGRYTFDECLAFPDDPWRVTGVRQDVAGGPVTVALNLPGANAPCPTEIVFDPQVNYLVRSIRTVDPGPKVTEDVTVVTRFREARPGVFFPEEVRSTSTYDGKLMGTEVVTFSDIKINTDVPKGTFDLKIPAGTKVTDETTGSEYTVAGDGGHQGEKALALPPPPSSGEPRTETKVEPRSLSWLILPAALCVLCGAVVARVILRRRARQ